MFSRNSFLYDKTRSNQLLIVQSYLIEVLQQREFTALFYFFYFNTLKLLGDMDIFDCFRDYGAAEYKMLQLQSKLKNYFSKLENQMLIKSLLFQENMV